MVDRDVFTESLNETSLGLIVCTESTFDITAEGREGRSGEFGVRL